MSRSGKFNKSATRQPNSIAEGKRKWMRLAIQLNWYSYDTAGRLIQQTMPNEQTVGYQLDANGNRTQLIYPDGYYAEYAYDELNRLTAISLNGSSTFAVSFEYDQLSRTTQMTYDNGCVCNYTYALNNDMSDQDFSFAGSSASFDYFYNRVHQIIGLVPSDSSFFWTPSSSSTIDYATANNLNQYPSVGSTGYSYDGNGCLTGGPQSTTFDSLSRVTQIVSGGTTNDYWTDPLNRQARKSVNGTDTNYLYDGNQLIATYDDSGELISRFICGDGIDEHFINITSSGNVYLHMDRIGSVIAETDASGGVLNKFAFSPFGESSSVSGSNFGYTGQRYDSEIGLYNYKMRYYSPTIGRFLQPDPLGYEAGDLNLYGYVANDPLNLTDSLGLNPDGSFYNSTTYSDPADAQYETTTYHSSGDYTDPNLSPISPPNWWNPLDWFIQPAYAYPKPFFPIPEQYARETTPGLLKRNFPTLTQKEADQLSKDILDKLKWKDITANDFKLIVKPPKRLKDIPPSVKKHAIEFLNGLPATDQPSVKKILQILQPSAQPPASSPSTKPGTPA